MGKRKGGRGKRTLNPDSIFWDSSSYRVVCKSWALASFRLLARHLGNAKNCQSLQYGNWVNFVKRNPYGKFLSRGACKDVFCVQNTKGELEAVRTFVLMCMYACMYVCMYVCIYVCMYVCVRESVCMCMYVCVYVYMCVCMYVYMYACMYVCMCVCKYVCVCICICMRVCIFYL